MVTLSNDFTGRWIKALRISYKQWLWIIRLFELELSARKISQQLGLSYPMALRAVNVIKVTIVATDIEGVSEPRNREIELDGAYFGGKRKGKHGRRAPVFGIMESDGVVRVEVVKDVSAETLLALTVKTVRRGAIVYTDKFRSYGSLMFCGYTHHI